MSRPRGPGCFQNWILPERMAPLKTTCDEGIGRASRRQRPAPARKYSRDARSVNLALPNGGLRKKNHAVIMPDQPPNNVQITLRQALEHEIVTLFCQLGPGGWKMPTLELRAETVAGIQEVTLTARAFDMQGTGEVAGAPEDLMRAAASYHALCNSFGQGWTKCLLTLTLSGKNKVARLQWDFSYA